MTSDKKKPSDIKKKGDVISTELGKQINSEIIGCFGKGELSLALIAKVYNDRKEQMNHVHVITLLQRCAKSRVDITKVISLLEIEKLLVREYKNMRPLNAIEVGSLMYSLRLFHDKSENIDMFLSTVTQLIYGSQEHLKSIDVGNTFLGFQRFSTKRSEVTGLLSVILPKIYQSEFVMDIQDISNAFFGMKNFQDCPEYRGVLDAFAIKIKHSSGEMNAKHMGNILHALNHLNSDIPSVQTILYEINNKLETSSDKYMNDKSVGSALYGLRHMNSNRKEVTEFLRVLSDKISNSTCSAPWAFDSISSSLYGLRGMNTDVAEVRQIINAIASKINMIETGNTTTHDNSQVIEGKSIANAMYGLRNFKSTYIEVRHLVRALNNLMKLPSSNDTTIPKSALFTSSDIALTL